MIFRRHAQGFHRHLLQRQQQLRPVPQQQFHIRSFELDGHFRAFVFGVDRLGFHHVVVQCQSSPFQ